MTGTQWLLLISFAVTLIFACLLLIDAVARGRPSGKMLQLAAAYRRYAPSAPQSEASALPGRNRRRRLTLLVLAVLVVLSVIWFGFLLSRAPGGRAVGPTSTHSVAHDGPSSSAGRSRASDPKSGSPVEQQNIELEDLAKFARPFQAVRIQGMYHGGADTFFRVQRFTFTTRPWQYLRTTQRAPYPTLTPKKAGETVVTCRHGAVLSTPRNDQSCNR
jgi:hypothetical protein